jgi:hypothetical protein
MNNFFYYTGVAALLAAVGGMSGYALWTAGEALAEALHLPDLKVEYEKAEYRRGPRVWDIVCSEKKKAKFGPKSETIVFQPLIAMENVIGPRELCQAHIPYIVDHYLDIYEQDYSLCECVPSYRRPIMYAPNRGKDES